ncbi:MAG: triose-phosphate isomerase [Pirellulales bacterium]|nr:triose-phosphate isomerase [Pirellulales bacterium]
MRRPFIAGNWKMNMDRASAIELAAGVAKATADLEDVDVAVCPPSIYLDAVVSATKGSEVGVGGQNMYHEPKGAFTGEISSAMLLDIGCQYVILGHSERRHIFGETDADINKKVKVALEVGLTPIVCVGETLPERESGETLNVIRTQFDGSLAGLSDDDMKKIVIAYEPVWAIGTGKTATPQQAEEVHLDLRKIMESCYNSEIAESVRIQYGGSVKPDNAAELLGQPNIDGALVGGASLKVDDFMGIIAGAK